jgi:RecJ-like exonuclease
MEKVFTCSTCQGNGHLLETDCCTANFYPPGWPDSDFCTACGEHASPYECDDCGGSGYRELTIEEQYSLEEAEAEMKSDESRGN